MVTCIAHVMKVLSNKLFICRILQLYISLTFKVQHFDMRMFSVFSEE